MNDFSALDKCLKKYIKEVKTWSPDRLININLETLHRLNALNYYNTVPEESALTRYFKVAETHEKITLVNDEFVIWIVPEFVDKTPVTYTFIALNQEDEPHLELTFIASGVYNNSKLVMRVLESLLAEIQENEDLLSNLKLNDT